MRQAKLFRTINQADTVIGMLVHERFAVVIAEEAWRNNQPNISCIPVGKYRVEWTFSPRFQRYTFQILDVPDRSAIRFHAGNSEDDTEGCLLPGTGITAGNLHLENSREGLARLEQHFAREPWEIEIINVF